MIKPLYLLVVEAEIQNRTGPYEFGQYFALINFSFILNILLDLGTSNWNTRRIANAGRVTLRQFKTMIVLRMALAVLYVIIAIVIGKMMGYSASQMWMLLILAFNQVLVSMILYMRSYLTGLHLFRQDSIISVLDRLLLLLMMSALLWTGISGQQKFQIEWLVWGQTISYGITLFIAFALVSAQGKKDLGYEEPISIPDVLKNSFPFALLILVSMIGYRIDAVMLERMTGSIDAGIYAMGFRFFEATNMIAYLFAVLLLPIFSRMLNNKEDVTALLHLSFKVLFSGTFIITTFCCFFGFEILDLIYDQHINEATPAFAWLMLSALFFSLQYVTGTLITASGNLRTLIYIAFAGMVYNIVLNIFYIPTMGAEGAARASCFTQAMIFFAQTGVVMHRHHHGSARVILIRTIGFMSVVIATGFALNSDHFNSHNRYFLAGVFLAVAFATTLFTGMLDYRQIPMLLKSRNTTT